MAINLLIEITVARPLIINNLVVFFFLKFKKKIVLMAKGTQVYLKA